LNCPKCRAVNPDTSRFCGTCAAPLGPGPPAPGEPSPPSSASATPPPAPPAPEAPSLTRTIEPHARGLAAGTEVAGKYRIVGEIGRGGMGVVYEAADLKLGRTVALKFLPGELTYDAEARERFVHEAHAASVLDNPHICTIYEIGESGSGQIFIAMALCHGESLRAKVKRGPLPPAEALSLASQVADGLAAAHESGIVHRDVKPGNILVSKDGTARIADFGLAKIAGEARLTRPGTSVGTVAYMSPEQIRGEDVDARTDVWSLGVVIYEMLTGGLPFHGENEHSFAYAILHSDPKPLGNLPPGTPEGCGPIIAKAMAKDPADRFASAGEMAEALASVMAGAGFRPHPHPRTQARPVLIKIALPAVLGAAAVYAVLALGVPGKIAALLGLGGRPAARHITIFAPTVLGESQSDRVLAAGLAEYLRLKLDEIARRSRSWVTPAEHLDTYDVREASDALRVLGSNVVLTGTLKRVGDNLTLTLDVLDPSGFRRLASVLRTDHIANIATWQDDVVLESAAALGLTAAPADRTALTAADTTVPGAFESYIRGLGLITSANLGPGPVSKDKAGALAEAIAAFEEAVRLDPSFAAAGIELAAAYMRKAAPGKDQSPAQHAEALIRAVLKSNDSLARGHFVLGAILRSLGRNDEAVRELERASALDPLYFDALTKLGNLYEDTNQPAKAEAAYRAALRARPGYWAAADYLGYFYFFQGAFDKARNEFETVTKLCPGNINGLNNLGAAHFKLGENARAEAAFERSNAIKRNPDACSNLAHLYFYRGRYADAVTMNEAAIGFGRGDYLLYGNLADAYHFTPGNEAKAAEAYRKAIELTEQALAADPGDTRSRSSLAAFLAKLGQGDRARTEIAEALRVKPDDSTVVLKSVVVYELSGARPQALEALRDYARLKGPMDEIAKDPFLAGLRQDRGYADIIEGKSAGTAGPKTDKTKY
jgi:tetratricopeptide (TPR) repeat protein